MGFKRFPEGHPAADHARRKGLVVKSGNKPLPETISSVELVERFLEVSESLAPLNKWLKSMLRAS